jgi:hypothetical protein
MQGTRNSESIIATARIHLINKNQTKKVGEQRHNTKQLNRSKIIVRKNKNATLCREILKRRLRWIPSKIALISKQKKAGMIIGTVKIILCAIVSRRGALS